MTHITLEEMVAFSQNRVSPDKRLDILTHLDQCALCRRELSLIAKTFVDDPKSDLATPSSDLIRRVLIASKQQHKRSASSLLPVQILYDSRNSPGVQGIRGAAHGRQMLFSIDSYDVDVHLFQTAVGQFSLQGQILPKLDVNGEVEGIRVDLTAAATTQRSVLTDSLGRFFLSGLATGVYTLTLALSNGNGNVTVTIG